MATDNIPTRSNGQNIDETWFNVLKSVLGTDFTPRTALGVATDLAGNLGQGSLQWLAAYIASGYFKAGDFKLHHSYNGAAPAGEGWMLCDGRQITLANYDTEHGSGHWVTYVGSSPLANKYLPDFTNRYPVGKATTTQDGSGALTPVGIAGHTLNLGHSHTVNAHNHQWTDSTGKTYDSGGSARFPNSSSTARGIVYETGNLGLGSASGINQDEYTTNASPGTDSQLASPQSIQPESIEVQVYMRII